MLHPHWILWKTGKRRAGKLSKCTAFKVSIERHGKLISDQAKAIEASWVVNGERKTKLYSQSNHKILLLRFLKKDGDQFAVVMKKRK